MFTRRKNVKKQPLVEFESEGRKQGKNAKAAESRTKRSASKAIENKTHSSKKAKKANNTNMPSHLLHKKFTVNAGHYDITPKDFPKNALVIVEKLQRAGFEAYVVGGCIRDLLLGHKPKDFDVATNAKPEEIQKIFGRQCRLIGRRFRLAHIVFGRDIYEVATFRADHSNHSSDKISKVSEEGMLLRDNVYGTLREDAQRRDFTVNSLYYDPKHNLIFDFFDGIADLKAGKLRLIGDPVVRYQEDPVRMLRAVRFMAKLDMFLDKPTDAPIRELAHLLKNIPAARLFDESLKLLQSGQGFKTYQLMRQYGLFEQLFPVLVPFFTERNDSNAERMLSKALNSTDDRIRDNLRVNPAFLFAALLWYPLREKMEVLKNEGGLNSHDAMMLAANDILAESCKAIALHRRHTSVIRDIWALQFQMTKRSGKRPQQTLEHVKFRAGFDLLVMRAEIEGGDLVELSAWWHEYQFSNDAQRAEMLKAVRNLPNFAGEEKKKRRRKTFRKKKPAKKATAE
ncbi:polynucleotide adenylyltransferase PcnB [Actinobacillus equuli subsp. haemolyticus]|uniref:polynucleotide adenylyltransferase PcnB n=1 Tax=Actinobacillus equuli TaxID=718 RepID=UPI0024416814|nr:polynucleotide adenylyltransferase PcnB [Actinobacillus equuli]WGE63418.1 polynucleotide adenylyltransferase PcnB [Actinobacillus equuli subsp. haemolyticus]WGE81578.1 polynucleotide adenylyltransferase PcnB [Actinobacillus equuli subsp. haemolyticus]